MHGLTRHDAQVKWFLTSAWSRAAVRRDTSGFGGPSGWRGGFPMRTPNKFCFQGGRTLPEKLSSVAAPQAGMVASAHVGSSIDEAAWATFIPI